MIEISRAHTTEHFQRMEALGRGIIPDVYAPYFPLEWAEYMIETGHTAVALAQQAAKGYRHYLVGGESLVKSESPAGLMGYFALQVRPDRTMELSHLYLRPDCRGKGFGRRIMAFVNEEAAKRGVTGIELWVLRKNVAVVNFYLRHGFVIAREVMTPMGPGAELEDFVMRKDMAWEVGMGIE
jgi:diamine N-acetyltransferase